MSTTTLIEFTTVIELAMKGCKHSVHAAVEGGLAYHPQCIGVGTFSDQWVVTHIASGRSAIAISLRYKRLPIGL